MNCISGHKYHHGQQIGMARGNSCHVWLSDFIQANYSTAQIRRWYLLNTFHKLSDYSGVASHVYWTYANSTICACPPPDKNKIWHLKNTNKINKWQGPFCMSCRSVSISLEWMWEPDAWLPHFLLCVLSMCVDHTALEYHSSVLKIHVFHITELPNASQWLHQVFKWRNTNLF